MGGILDRARCLGRLNNRKGLVPKDVFGVFQVLGIDTENLEAICNKRPISSK